MNKKLLIVIIPLLLTVQLVASKPEGESIYKELYDNINLDNIKYHVKYLSSLDTLFVGYEGYYKAADYIESKFREYGLKVWRHEFKVVVPIDEGSYIIYRKTGEKLRAYAMLPNLVQTCSGRISGELVYVKGYDLQELSGVSLEDKIVLMEYNTYRNWLYLANLGAKAVIFIEPSETDLRQSIAKVLSVPLNFTRVYVTGDVASRLKEIAREGGVIDLVVNMKFKEVVGYNIIGELKGELENDVILMVSHYDSWSAVPGRSLALDDIVSVSSLLEIARIMSKYKHKRTIWFVAFGGHWQALAGPRSFVEDYCFNETVQRGELKLWMAIGIDFSLRGNKTALVDAGYFYSYDGGNRANLLARFRGTLRPLRTGEVSPIERYLARVIEEIYEGRIKLPQLLDSGIVEENIGWWASIQEPYILDTEPFMASGGIGFTFYTGDVFRPERGTTVIPKRSFNYENLKPQIIVALATLYGFANEEDWALNWDEVKASRAFVVSGGATALYTAKGFNYIEGKVVEYSLIQGKYIPVPNAIVVIHRGDPINFPYNVIYTFADKNGTFRIYGSTPNTGIMSPYGGYGSYHVSAYVLDDKGRVIYAPDYGIYGHRRFPSTVLARHEINRIQARVFRVKGRIYLYGLVDPYTVSVRSATRYVNPFSYWASPPTFYITLFKSETLSEPMSFYVSVQPPVAVIFTPRELNKVTLLIKYGALGRIVGLLQEIPISAEVHVHRTIYNIAINLYNISSERYLKLKNSFIEIFLVEETLSHTRKLIDEAKANLIKRDYNGFFSSAIFSWLWSIDSYRNVMAVVFDVANTSAIFFVLLLPFTFFFERLVFHAEGYKRFAVIVSTAILLTVFFSVIHPSTKLASNAYVGFLGVTLGGIFIAIIVLFTEELRSFLKEIRKKLRGEHFIEKGLVPMTTIAFSVALENMRVRKLRTVLVLFTIITTVFSLIALASFSYAISVYDKYPIKYEGEPPYEGLLVKLGIGAPWDLMGQETLSSIQAMVGLRANISPRVWLYPTSRVFSAEGVLMKVKSTHGETYIRALLGLSPTEPMNPLDLGVIYEGKALRWFIEEDKYVCYIPSEIASQLNVDVGDTINVAGIDLRILGIYDEKMYDYYLDIFGDKFTPLNPQRIISLSLETLPEEEFVTLPFGDVIIVPYELALELGGNIASIAITSNDAEYIDSLAWELAAHTAFDVILSKNGEVFMLHRRVISMIRGLEYIAFPLIIGSLNIFITILGSIKERENEIKIYSSLGLSPTGVFALFLVETMTYAFIAIVPGYILGILFNVYLVANDILPPGFSANYTSSAEVYTVSITLLATIAASLYPIMRVSRTVTPSFERKWKIPTKPVGDTWEIPLPFSVTNEKSVKGIIYYLQEFFKGLMIETDQPYIVRALNYDLSKNEIDMVVALKPIESNVTQDVIIRALRVEENKFSFTIIVKRRTGAKLVWKSSNYRFIDAVRKQLLTWRFIGPEKRRRYIMLALKSSTSTS